MQKITLGRYRIERELGRGSMGRVLLAHDPEIDRQVALKTINVFSSLPEEEREEARKRFLREVRSAGKLLHPGIVTIFDVGEEGGVPYLAMEYVDGRTLDAFCREGKLLPVEVAVELVARVAGALDYAHRSGIVHRDIKPANLVRVKDGSVKIMDFGLAKGPLTSLTQDGALLGTPSYMSPEQVRGESVEGKSDLFSLGVVLYELLTGVKPFSGDSISSVLFRIVNEEPRDATALKQSLPKAILLFLKKALAKNPEDRYPTGEAFAEALRGAGRVLRQAGPHVPASPVSSPVSRPVAVPARKQEPAPVARSSRMPFFLGIAVLAALVAGGGFYFREPFLDALSFLIPQPVDAPPFETRVRTDPPGLLVLLNGEPLEGDLVRFPVEGPHGVLTTTQRCRRVEHSLSPEDAGMEVVLVPDPVQVEVDVDPGVQGAVIRLNGAKVGKAPARIQLDLCRENELEVLAEGYYPATRILPAGAGPLMARTALATISMETIPMGRLLLPEQPMPVRFYVDGKSASPTTGGMELQAGEHRVRVVSKKFWVDIETRVNVPPGGSATPDLDLPDLTVLAVQAFPPNCKVSLRRPGGSWVYLDTTPVRRRIAAGTYEVRIEFIPTGEVRERTVHLNTDNPSPIRFSFARSQR